MIKIFFRYFYSINSLSGKQIVYRIFKTPRRYISFIKVHLNNKSNLLVKKNEINKELRFIIKKSSYLGNNIFKFLNFKQKINVNIFPKLNFNDKLWIYNLNYFDYLNSEHNYKNKYQFIKLINKWIDNNEFLDIENDPYPTSLRIINWIKWSLQNNYYEKKFLKSLYIQLLYLNENIEYDLLGNHLFTNAKALFIGSLFLKSKKTNQILKKSLLILNSEISEQINEDGSHCELSPMYHSLILEDLLDILNFMSIYNFKNNKNRNKIISIIKKMFLWLENLQIEKNKFSFFNDSAYEIAPNFEKLINYAKYLGIHYNNVYDKNFHYKYFKNSGFINSFSDKARLNVDLGKIGYKKNPGHAHADCLSFELALFGGKFIVNSGTSTYQNNNLRKYQRSTASHNTLYFENINSSDIWKSFRVGKTANTKIKKISFNKSNFILNIFACHNGFSSINKNRIHSRKFSFKKNSLLIIDHVKGDYKKAKVNYFLHPEVKIKDNHTLMFKENEVKIQSFNSDIIISKSFWYPEFGIRVENNLIQLILTNHNKCGLKIKW